MSQPALVDFTQKITPPRSHGKELPLRLLLAICCTCLFFGSGCTTTRTVDPQTQPIGEVKLKVDEKVGVLLRNGHKLELKVADWTDEFLIGRDETASLHTISWRDVAQLQVTRVSPGKTALLVVGVGGAVLVIAAAGASAAWYPAPGL
jgi:hypothetical protein